MATKKKPTTPKAVPAAPAEPGGIEKFLLGSTLATSIFSIIAEIRKPGPANMSLVTMFVLASVNQLDSLFKLSISVDKVQQCIDACLAIIQEPEA